MAAVTQQYARRNAWLLLFSVLCSPPALGSADSLNPGSVAQLTAQLKNRHDFAFRIALSVTRCDGAVDGEGDESLLRCVVGKGVLATMQDAESPAMTVRTLQKYFVLLYVR